MKAGDEFNSKVPVIALTRGCANACRQVAAATKLHTVATNVCGSSVLNLLHFTFLPPGILGLLPDVLQNCVPLPYEPIQPL